MADDDATEREEDKFVLLVIIPLPLVLPLVKAFGVNAKSELISRLSV